MLVCNEGIKLGLSDCEVFSITPKDTDGNKVGGDEGSELGFPDGSFDSSSDGNFDSSLLGESLESDLQPELGSFYGY